MHTWEQSIVGSITHVAFSPDGTQLLTPASVESTATGNPVAHLWNTETGAPHTTVVGKVTTAAFDDTGEREAAADGEVVCVWDTASWQPEHEFTWPAPQSDGNWEKSASFSPNSALLAVGDDSGVLHILDVLGARPLLRSRCTRAQSGRSHSVPTVD
jgi:WD40 repeat protein